MDEYEIRCTEKQAKKALELGAPLETRTNKNPFVDVGFFNCRGQFVCESYDIPTAGQMIGWLESTIRISDIDVYRGGSQYWTFSVTLFCGNIIGKENYFTRKEATLAAIDAALNYLINRKEEKS